MKKLVMLICVCFLAWSLVQKSQIITEAVAAEQIVLVSLVTPIEVQKSIQTGAKFQELTQEAMKYGMSDVVLNGRVTYAPQEDNTIRSTVFWDSISMESGGKKLSEPLASPLESKVRTQQPQQQSDLNRVETGTVLKAKGDVQTLAEALGRLKKQLDDKDKPLVEKTTENKVEKTAVAPVVTSNQDQGQQSVGMSPTGPISSTVDTGTTTSSEKCPEPFIDYDKMKVVAQYKAVYTKAGVKTGEGVCSPNYNEAKTIQKKDGDCSYRFDFSKSLAVKQEQWFYAADNGSDVMIGSCQDSNSSFPLTESRTGCPVTADMANKVVFPQSKIVFTVGNVEQNATECRAVSGATGLALEEENCDPMFEHDFVNNVSYLRTRSFYISDIDKAKVYVNACSRSSSASYPHISDTNGCGWVMDDEKMIAYQQAKTIIETGQSSGRVVVKECHTTASVNYTFLGAQTMTSKLTTNTAWTIPATAKNPTLLVVGRGQDGNGVAATSCDQCEGSVCLVSAGIGYSGKPGKLQYVDLAGSQGQTLNVQFNKGTGTKPGDTIVTIGATTITAQGGGSETAGAWGNSVWNSSGCYAPQITSGFSDPNNPAGVGTLGRYGLNGPADYPKAGGCGWGAGGKGGSAAQTANCNESTDFGSTGAPGVAIIEYSVNKYMRPDGSTFIPSN